MGEVKKRLEEAPLPLMAASVSGAARRASFSKVEILDSEQAVQVTASGGWRNVGSEGSENKRVERVKRDESKRESKREGDSQRSKSKSSRHRRSGYIRDR